MVRFKVKNPDLGWLDVASLKFTEKLSVAPGEFTLVAPYQSLKDLSAGDEIQIYKDGDKIFTGLVQKIEYKHSSEGEMLQVSGYDLKFKLLQKIFHDPDDPTKYYHGYVDAEPSDIVRDITNQAELDPSGIDDTTLTLTFRFYYENLLQALRHVAEVVGWEFKVGGFQFPLGFNIKTCFTCT